jgi:hypothetical protein
VFILISPLKACGISTPAKRESQLKAENSFIDARSKREKISCPHSEKRDQEKKVLLVESFSKSDRGQAEKDPKNPKQKALEGSAPASKSERD